MHKIRTIQDRINKLTRRETLENKQMLEQIGVGQGGQIVGWIALTGLIMIALMLVGLCIRLKKRQKHINKHRFMLVNYRKTEEEDPVKTEGTVGGGGEGEEENRILCGKYVYSHVTPPPLISLKNTCLT